MDRRGTATRRGGDRYRDRQPRLHHRAARRGQPRHRAGQGMLYPDRPWRQRPARRNARAAVARARHRQARHAADRRGGAQDRTQPQIRHVGAGAARPGIPQFRRHDRDELCARRRRRRARHGRTGATPSRPCVHRLQTRLRHRRKTDQLCRSRSSHRDRICRRGCRRHLSPVADLHRADGARRRHARLPDGRSPARPGDRGDGAARNTGRSRRTVAA